MQFRVTFITHTNSVMRQMRDSMSRTGNVYYKGLSPLVICRNYRIRNMIDRHFHDILDRQSIVPTQILAFPHLLSAFTHTYTIIVYNILYFIVSLQLTRTIVDCSSTAGSIYPFALKQSCIIDIGFVQSKAIYV